MTEMFDKRQNKEKGGLKREFKKNKKETSFTVRRRADWW